MKSCHLQVNGCNWRTSSEVKLARLRKPKTTFSLMCGIRPNTNAAILQKTGHTKGGGCHTREKEGKRRKLTSEYG
jgi:hypothetical protein